jgi:amino acid adenylation domain-containing protein
MSSSTSKQITQTTSLQSSQEDEMDAPETQPTSPSGQGDASVLQLPYDCSKTPLTTDQPDQYHFSFGQRLVASLYDRAEQEAVAVPTFLVAALQSLLYRYTQQDAIAVGLITTDRHRQQEYTSEISSQFFSHLSAGQLVNRLSESLSVDGEQALQHSTDGLESRSAAKPASQSPVVLTLLEQGLQFEDGQQWLTNFQHQSRECFPALDLHLVILPQDTGLSAIIEYNTKLFYPETIQRLAGHFQIILEGIVSDLECPVVTLPLLSEAERQQLLVAWNSPSVDYPQQPLYRSIERHAIQTPEAIAMRFQDQYLTYADLNQRANQVAHYLKSVGVTPGDRVAVCVQPCLDIGASLLGIFKAGGVYVPLDPTHPPERLTAILQDTQANVLLTQSSLLPNLPDIATHSLSLDTQWDIIQAFPTHNPDRVLDLDQAAYIIYTSGTTGKPKGVMASHRNLVNYILATQERLGFKQSDVMPSIARFTFSIAIFELLSPLVAGGTLVILERDHILDFARLTKTLEQLTMLHTVPSLMQKLLRYIQDNDLDLKKFHQVKHVFTGGDSVPPDLLETMKQVFQQAQVAVLYGCSEVSSLCATFPVPRDQVLSKSRVGKPFNNVSIRLYDPNQNLVPIGVPGEIYVGGAGVTSGYLNRADLTQEKFITIDGQRFYRTGDMGRLGTDGNLEFLGRADFQIKLRGIRIELGDIESTLRQAPGVREGVVVAHELEAGKSLVAYIVLDPAQTTAIADIRRFLQAKLPDYMVPAAFIKLDAMPLNHNQKVDRRALPLPTAETFIDNSTIVAPRDDLERQLTAIWERVLKVQPIGIHHNFFEVGGNSLLAVQMLTQVEKLLGKNLPLTALLQSSTIATLAETLRHDNGDNVTVEVVPLRATGTKPPLFCIYGVLLYRELMEQLPDDQPVYGVYLQEEVDLLKQGRSALSDSVFSSVTAIAALYLQVIRKLRPHGPYYLAGESFGGVVAFEMAQQLQADGEDVALVALMDAANPACMSSLPLLQRIKIHRQHLSQQSRTYVLNLAKERFLLAPKKLFDSLSTVHRYGKLVADDRTESDIEFYQDDVRHAVRNQVIQSYKPKPYAGKVVLFRAMERDPFEGCQDYALGWGALATEGLHIYDVPGDHVGILKEPNVRVMANYLQAYLA